MPRITAISLSALTLAALLTACNKAPAPAASVPNAETHTVAAAFSAGVTYDCHSAQKTRDIFVRFDADGTVNMGADATSLKSIGEVVTFDKSGIASWSKKTGSWVETNTFDKSKGTWDWSNDPGAGMVDSAHYDCKAI